MSKKDARKIEAILDQVTTLNGRETELLAEELVRRGVGITKENTK